MIKIKKRRASEDPMNSGSLTDLAFLLIIYFIVIAGFNVNKGYLLNLPEKEKPRIVQTKELMTIALGADGQVYYENEIIDLKELSDTVGLQRRDNPETTLLLIIHGDCPYQSMVDLIYTIRELRVENFSFKMLEEGA